VEEKLPVSEKQYAGAMEACMRQVRGKGAKQSTQETDSEEARRGSAVPTG